MIHKHIRCVWAWTLPCSSFCFPGPARNVHVTALSAQSQQRRMGSLLVYFLDTKSLWPESTAAIYLGPYSVPAAISWATDHILLSVSIPGLPSADTCFHVGLTGYQKSNKWAKRKQISLPLTPCWLVMVRGKVCVEWTTCVPNALPDCWECWYSFGTLAPWTGIWQSFPVKFGGHWHLSLELHWPPFIHGRWQMTKREKRKCGELVSVSHTK